MGMHSQLLPPIPAPAIVAEVVRLAEAAEAERHEQWPLFRLDPAFRPTPAQDAFLALLRGLPDETVAGLYGLYRLGDRPYPTPAGALERYRCSFEVALRPLNRRHGAKDLAAKGPLAHGLRRGLERLGLEPIRSATFDHDIPRTS